MLLSKIKNIIAEAGLAAQVEGPDELDIRYLLTDSRELASFSNKTDGTGEAVADKVVNADKAAATLFFAIRTSTNDGARYISELRAKGVKAFVTGDAVAALQAVAAYKRSLYNGPEIGRAHV